jgi:hypothetical protein
VHGQASSARSRHKQARRVLAGQDNREDRIHR